MNVTENDPRIIIITSEGTFCLYGDSGRFIGTISRPVDRRPVGPGRDTVYLERASLASANAA